MDGRPAPQPPAPPLAEETAEQDENQSPAAAPKPAAGSSPPASPAKTARPDAGPVVPPSPVANPYPDSPIARPPGPGAAPVQTPTDPPPAAAAAMPAQANPVPTKAPQPSPATVGSGGAPRNEPHARYARLQAAASEMASSLGRAEPEAEPPAARSQPPAATPAAASQAAPAQPRPTAAPDARVGRVVSVSGAQAVALLEGDGPENQSCGLEIGKLVTMRTDRSVVFGLVAGLSIPVPSQDPTQSEVRVVELELLGETRINERGRRLGFQRGVTSFPSLGDGVFHASQEDLEIVFASPDGSNVRVGSIHQDRRLPACVAVDDLLGKHFAMLGTTGSGKSCAVALILRQILQEHQNGHVVLLDPHNEYHRAFGEMAELIDPGTLELPFWLFNFEEFVEVVLGRQSSPDGIEASILNELIPIAKRQFLGDAEDHRYVTADTPSPYRFNYLIQLIDEIIGKLEKPEDLGPYMRLKARLKALQADSRFSFMFGSVALRDNMSQIISRIFRIPVQGRPITIIDLSGVPSEILNVVVSVLCRMTFDFAIWSDRALPILFVCEEAHRYAPRNPSLGFEPTKRALSRIAKEGRKYGVSLCVITQRPSELDTDILSQCNTIFSLRMSNSKDQDFVRSTLSESAEGLMYFLPLLRTAEAIAVGEGVPVPVRICFDELPREYRPLSGTAPFSNTWKIDKGDSAFIDAVIDRWRRQQR